jgi:membrane protein DedA with SNARE-associated domain
MESEVFGDILLVLENHRLSATEKAQYVPVLDIQVIQHLLVSYGYLAVFALVLFESAGIPLPGETALIAAAVYAGTQHKMNIGLVIAAAAGGAMLGDNLGFWIGRKLGRAILAKYGHRIGLDQRKLDLAEYLFMRHGGKIVFFGRFVALLRALTAILAGASQFQPLKFLFYNAAGGIVWAALFGSGGYLLGKSMASVSGPLGWGALTVACVGGFLLWRYFKSNEDRLLNDATSALENRKNAQTYVRRGRSEVP